MPDTYTYDSCSFIINGERVWIHDGEIHYYRFPRAEWKRVLTVAKAGGLNCISTYVAWNYHEEEEGKWDFTGDRDLAAFIDLAGELGLYVMVRPGPYICAEWKGGGIPAWLLEKPDMELRTDNAVFMKYTREWYRRFMEIAAPRQVTRGGNIITIQNDNEYHGGWDEATCNYIEKLYGYLREFGAEVAITACNCHTNSKGGMLLNYGAKFAREHVYDDMIVTFNTCAPSKVIPELRAFQPDKPAMVTELWTGPMVFWDEPTGIIEEDGIARWITEFASLRTQICMYMFAGGTNFGFNAASNLATSYASDYPVGDGATPRHKYYLIKPIAGFLQAYGPQLSVCESDETVTDEGTIRILAGDEGGFLFAFPNDFSMTIPNTEMRLRFSYVKAGVYPYRLRQCGHVIDYSDLQILSRIGDTVYLYGEAGDDYTISIDGQRHCVTVSSAKPVVLPAPVRMVILDTRMAQRFWRVKDGAVIGGALAYDGENGIITEPDEKNERVFYDINGVLSELQVPSVRHNQKLPELSDWQSDDVLNDTVFTDISAPVSHEALGVKEGHVWYKAHVNSPERVNSRLMATCFTNRITVYVNGSYCGSLGEFRNGNQRNRFMKPANVIYEQVDITLEKGYNEILFISVDTGYCAGDIKPLGFLGDVYADTQRYMPAGYTYLGKTPLSEYGLKQLYSPEVPEKRELDTISFSVPCDADESFFVMTNGILAYPVINDGDSRAVKVINKPFMTFGDGGAFLTYLPEKEQALNTVCIQYTKCDTDNVLSHIFVYKVKKASLLTGWQWARFEDVPRYTGRHDTDNKAADNAGRLEPFAAVPDTAVKNHPRWFSTSFKRPDSGYPIGIAPGMADRGHIYLNGHGVGRLNGTLTQKWYYIPESWFEDENVLTILEENGNAPIGAKLVGISY